MKMAIRDGKILIAEADATQAAVLRSWGAFRYVRGRGWYEGELSRDLLNRLAKLIRLPGPIEAVRVQENRTQEAVDRLRTMQDPQPLRPVPLKGTLYQHQIRAYDMALVEMGFVDPEEVLREKEDKDEH